MAIAVVGSPEVRYKVSEDEVIKLSFDMPFRRINIMETLEEKLGTTLPDLESKCHTFLRSITMTPFGELAC